MKARQWHFLRAPSARCSAKTALSVITARPVLRHPTAPPGSQDKRLLGGAPFFPYLQKMGKTGDFATQLLSTLGQEEPNLDIPAPSMSTREKDSNCTSHPTGLCARLCRDGFPSYRSEWPRRRFRPQPR